jgi:DNA-binding CsgD family transcriptional regulator
MKNLMTDNQDYKLFHSFIETFSPIGFNGIDSNDRLVLEMEQMMQRNNQFITVGDIFESKTYFISKRSFNIIGTEPFEFSPYHIIEATHPNDFERYMQYRSKSIIMANELLLAKKGEMLLASNIKIRDCEGVYSNVLIQCYLFYSEIPRKTVYFFEVYTNINWCKKIKQGFHFYSGKDISRFKYPNNALLNNGDGFTKREFEIIKLIESGLSSEQIAKKLFLSTYTINTHRGNILKKSGKAYLPELIYELMEQGKL